jgi:amino acid transporter
MAQRRLHGLQRVLGVNALFSTAYGNVGSSIYYALGLVAALALGLTPIVFILAGALFYCTATTYAEATAMYPEAGGASLFARRAFNEFWSFFTAWAQMLNYVITIAISAFFAAHYAGGVTFRWFETAPGDVFFGIGLIALLALINTRGVSEAVGVNVVLAVVDFLSQLTIVAVGAVLVLSPEILLRNLEFFGEAPTLSQFLLAIPIGTIAYTGIETISNMAGEAKDEDTTIPASIRRVMIAVFAIYFTLPMIALSALPVECDAAGKCETLLGVAAEDGGYANNPIVGIVETMELGALQAGAELYVGILAVTILVAATNAGVLGVSRLVYSMGIYRQLPDRVRQLHPRYQTPYIGILVFSALACVALIPGRPTSRVDLRVRGDAVVLDGPPGGDPAADHRARPPPAVPQPRDAALPRDRPAAVRRHRPDGHRPVVRRGQRPRPHRRIRRDLLAGPRHRRLHRLPAPAGARPGHHLQGRHAAAGRRPRGRVRLDPRRVRERPLRAGRDRHRRQARRPAPGAASTCSRSSRCPPRPTSPPRCPRRSSPPRR